MDIGKELEITGLNFKERWDEQEKGIDVCIDMFDFKKILEYIFELETKLRLKR